MGQDHKPKFEGYEVVRRLGRGGFSVVYLAKQLTTGQLCAIKTIELDPELDETTREQSLARFEREMTLIGQLKSPYIVRLFDSGVVEGSPYMVLEHIEGRPLSQLLQDSGALSEKITTRLTSQVLEAIAEAHDKGIIHRDLKPGNIMVMGTEQHLQVKVLDFGIARFESVSAQARRITLDGQLWGTPSYMAPELLQRTPLARLESDVYALGLIILECLTGETVITAEDIKQVCIRQLLEPIVVPDAFSDTPLGLLVEKACQKEAEKRFGGAREMLEALTDPEGTRKDVLVLRQQRVEQEGPSTQRSTPHALGLESDAHPELVVSDATPASPISLPPRAKYFRWVALLIGVGLVAMVVLAFFALEGPSNGPTKEASGLPAPGDTPPPPPAAEPTPTPAETAPVGSVRPSDELIASLLLEAEAVREEDPARAVELYQKVLAIEPRHPQALEGLGWSFLGLKLFKEALAAFTLAVEAGIKTESLLLGLAISYEANKRLGEALEAYQNFLNLFPESTQLERIKEKVQTLEADLGLGEPVVQPPLEKEKPTKKKSEETKPDEVVRPPVFGLEPENAPDTQEPEAP